MNIFLDIETIGTQRADVREYIAKSVTHPGTISLPASIQKWNLEKRPDALEEAIAKTSFDGAFGQIVCIGFDLRDNGNTSCIFGLDEVELLVRFNSILDSEVRQKDWFTTCVVGHNVSSFDLRFLVQRYIVHGIRPHMVISRAAQAKPWDIERVYDTMTQWHPDRDKRISLDKLCLALGLPGKTDGIDGSMVAGMVADGKIEQVADYCKNDVAITRAVFRRMTFQL